MIFLTQVCLGGLPVGGSIVEQNGARLRSQGDLGSNPSCAFRSCVILSKSFNHGLSLGFIVLARSRPKSLSQVPLKLSATSQPW